MSAQALSHCTRRLARPLYITIRTTAIKAKIITKMIRPANIMGILPEAKRERRNAARIKPRWAQVNGGAKIAAISEVLRTPVEGTWSEGGVFARALSAASGAYFLTDLFLRYCSPVTVWCCSLV